MTTDHVHEEIQLLANDFSTMLFETLAHVPRWRDYYLAHDQTPHYEYLETQLKAMQFLRGGRRWLLKSPQHLEQLPVLNKVFPERVRDLHPPRPRAGGAVDARDDHLHRTHVLLAGARERRSRRPGSTGWARMLDALVRDRDTIPPERSIDVRFDEFMADEMAVAAQVYEKAGEALDDDARAAIGGYLAGHQRGRLGTVATSPEMFGLEERDLHEPFAPYVERFLSSPRQPAECRSSIRRSGRP